MVQFLSRGMYLCGVVILLTTMLVGCTSPQSISSQNNQPETGPRVCFQEMCWSVEIADEGPEQQKGLMNRTSLDTDKGMLFVFPKEGVRQFWMKNTLIPLDMLWLNEQGQVVYIASDVLPCPPEEEHCPTYGPTEHDPKAKYVLELAAGQAHRYTIGTGSFLTLP